MEHRLFKPASFEEGKEAVVGCCNGIPMAERWRVETPLFAKEILRYYQPNTNILDYGCGVGRLAKEILTQNPAAKVIGVDASPKMLAEAANYAGIVTKRPEALTEKFSVAYLVYVLQHVPAIEIRETLARIYSHLEDDGTFIYCSSDWRMAIRFDKQEFFNDQFLGVNLQEEVSRLFEYRGELFDRSVLDDNPLLKTMIEGNLPHPAKVYSKKAVNKAEHILLRQLTD